LELCDGWYPIKAMCDSHLATYITKRKLNIGSKIAIFNAELFGCPKDGCPPLEAPEDMYLKLSINSTRKAKWFARLGFIKPQRPLSVSLNSIYPNSIIGALDVVVERIYPILVRLDLFFKRGLCGF
jgi:breast cancer 2 susceptibility protein